MLVAGGWNGDELASAEIYDATTDTWSAAAPMGERRGHPDAALLADGRVLVAGGYGFENLHPTASRTSEIYDPRTNTWSPAGDLNTPRGEASAMVTLDDGRPAITGGFWWSVVNPGVGGGLPTWSGSRYEDTLEIFDPAGGTWSRSAVMKRGRAGHVALTLNGGSVLVAGGFGAGTLAERFTLPEPIEEPPPAATPTPTPTVTPVVEKVGRVAFRSPARRMSVSRTGVLTIKLRCDATGDCNDRLVLRVRKAVLARAAVPIAAGRTRSVKLKLSGSARRKLSRKGTKVTLALTGSRVSMTATVKRRERSPEGAGRPLAKPRARRNRQRSWRTVRVRRKSGGISSVEERAHCEIE